MTDKLQAVREALQEIHDNVFNWERRSIRDIAAKALSELSANTEAQLSGSSAASIDSDEFWNLLLNWAERRDYTGDKRSARAEQAEDLILAHIQEWQARASLSAPAQEDARDAVRYRYLRATTKAVRDDDGNNRTEVTPDQFDFYVDAAIAKEAGN